MLDLLVLLNQLIIFNVILAIVLVVIYVFANDRFKRWVNAFSLCYCFIIGLILVALGWNTLDWMMNTFAWGDSIPAGYEWWMNTYAKWDWWNCFIYFGVLPLGLGAGMFGGCLIYVACILTRTIDVGVD